MPDLKDATIDQLVEELTSREGVRETSHNGKLDGSWLEEEIGNGIYTILIIGDAE